MQRLPLQLSISALLILMIGVALNIWLFRFGMLAGIVGLSVTKHVVIAWLCQVLGIDRRGGKGTSLPAAAPIGLPAVPAAGAVTAARPGPAS